MTFPVYPGSNPSGYNLTRSLRLRSSASAYLNRTPAGAGNRKIWTWSGWVKRGTIGVDQFFFTGGYNTAPWLVFGFLSNNLYLSTTAGVSASGELVTTAVYRDPSAWYHIVLSVDTTQATASNRIKFYVNGVQITAFSTTNYPSQNADLQVNAATPHTIGGYASYFYDGYLAEVNFIDGQALTPSSFGETDTITGVWKPKAYSGTYGTNGFYLPFTDNSALTTSSNVGLGKDFSGNGNYWTTNNISITSGVTYDSMTDVPTLTSATAANFCTLNPLDNLAAVPSGGNLNQGASNPYTRCNSTIFVSSGKWYFEVTLNTAGTNTSVGIGQNNNNVNQYPGYDAKSFVQEIDNARKGTNDTYTAYGTALTAGQVFMCAIDLDNLKLFFGGQGTWFASSNPVTGANPAFTVTAGLYCAISRPYGGSAAISINFGQRPFAYTPPTGFVALNTYNLPTSTIVKGNTVMDATLYTGNGSTQTITNAAGFKPDFVWGKMRASNGGLGEYHQLYDSIRGVEKALFSNTTDAETNMSGGGVTAFNTNGFNVSATSNGININAKTYVGWQWQAGQGSTSSNTNGTITSTVSVNASAGFSVVTYTGNGSAGATIGHGLGVAPSLMFVKSRSATGYWLVYSSVNGNTKYMTLNTADAVLSSSGAWNNTSPTSSVFSVGSSADVNSNGTTYVAYCWAPIAGFSAFGSYTGNGSSDGTFVYTGFKPRYVMFKRTDSAASWIIRDTARDPYNVSLTSLYANLSDGDDTSGGAAYGVDILSNGFKLRGSGGGLNASGGTFIYAAFSSNPFKNSLAQ